MLCIIANTFVNIKNMALNISFFPRLRSAQKTTTIYCSISDGNERLIFTTGLNVPASLLTRGTAKTGYRKKGSSIFKLNHENYFAFSKLLNDAKNVLYAIQSELGATAPLEQIKQEYIKRNTKKRINKKYLAELLKDFINENSLKWSTGTIQIYNALHLHIINHIEKAQAANFDHDAANDFIKKLSESGMANNTVNKYIKSLKAFLRWSKGNEFIKVELDTTKIKTYDKNEAFKVALTDSELEILENIQLPMRLERVRDLFIVQCYSGQRISDLHKIVDAKNFIDNSIGFIQQKTSATVFLPMYVKLKERLEAYLLKYENKIPQISDQRYNEYLKEVAVVANLNRLVSREMRKGEKVTIEKAPLSQIIASHDARRTFCSRAYLKGINPMLIMKISGHKKTDQFFEYIDVSSQQVTDEFNAKM